MVRRNSTTGTPLAEPVRLGSGSFTRAGSTIHYWTAGEVAAPAVVLTHGVTVDHGTWAHQLDPLTQAGYRVVAWDMRGHGLSQPMGDRLSIELAADDLAALLDEVGVEEAVLVGQSFAGFVVQDFYQRWPKRVRALVLVGATALGERIPLHQRLLQRTRPLLLRLWPEGHLRRVTPSFLSRRPTVQRYIARAMAPLSKDDLVAVTQAALEGLLRQRPMGPLEVPVLLVRGDEEMAPIARMMDAWALRDTAVRLEVVNGAGHLVNQEGANDFNEILLRFVRDDVAA